MQVPRPYISFLASGDKEAFKAIVKALPRPLRKKVDFPEQSYATLVVEAKTESILTLRASIDQSVMCELVEPAKAAVYRCAPILSEEEDRELELEMEISEI